MNQPEPPPFDQLAEDGITAYCESVAEQMAPDDPGRQALIVEGLRALSGRGRAQAAPVIDVPSIGRQMLQTMQPGAGSRARFFARVNPGTKQPVKIWDFFHLAEASLYIDVNHTARTMQITTRTGFSVVLDTTTTEAFNGYICEVYGMGILSQ